MLKIFYNKYKINNLENYSNINFSLDNNSIVNVNENSVEEIQVLDIPKNTELYYFTLESYKNYILIYVNIYIDKLKNKIVNGLEIIERKNIFDFLEKYYDNNNIEKKKKINLENIYINRVEDWILTVHNNFKKQYEYYTNKILKINDIYYDLKKCSFNTDYNKKYINVKGCVLFDEINYRKIMTILKRCTNIVSKKNLILCPKFLVNYWIEEINKLNNQLKIISIINKKDFDLYTYNDLITADYVIFSINFFSNNNYKNLWKKYKLNDDITYDDCINNMKLEIFRNINFLELVNPFLSLIDWNMVIIDEYVEIINGNTYSIDVINSIKSVNKFFLFSKIPENQTELFNILSVMFEFPKNFFDNNTLLLFDNNNIIDIIQENIYINKNKYYEKINLNEEIIYLDFSNFENILYNSYLDIYNKHNNSIHKLYTIVYNQILEDMYTSFINCKTLDEIRNYILTLNKNKLEKLNKIKNKLLHKKVELENKRSYHIIKNLSNINNNIDEINKNINNTTNYINNYNNLDFIIDKCSICLEKINENDVGITICGHIFCFLCIIESIKYNNSCPYCRSRLQNKDVFKIINTNYKTDLDIHSFNNKIKKINKNKNNKISFSYNPKNNYLYDKINDNNYDCTDITVLIELYGTKIANLIYYLKNIFYTNEKIIIHTILDDEIVNNICDILNKYNIKTLNCYGNDSQRNDIIYKFNDKNYNVLIISTKYISCYTIKKITKIIFLEPLFDMFKKDYNKHIINLLYNTNNNENIKIIKFVIKNSIEEDINSNIQ